MEKNKGVEAIVAKTRLQWRKWLQKNSQKREEICLVIFNKKSKVRAMAYSEAVEEALCFGWIDSLTNRRDEGSFYQRFSPRRPKSNWSQPNIERAEKMITAGFMTEHGQRAIDLAKQTGKWAPAMS